MPIHPLLSDSALDFARRHLTAYYDTDFFPKPVEFECLWYKWDTLKTLVLNGMHLPTGTPIAIPWKKARGGYRVVHQMDPIDSICYTAAVHTIAANVELARMPRQAGVACSYRIRPDHTGFFVAGSGFENYRERCEQLAKEFKFVLKTDISDFYNQIYLHRLAGAISQANNDDSGKLIEHFLMQLYPSKSSQGIPVGPAASIILSEAALIDIDQFIQGRGYDHARYVDDIRVFGHTARQLELLLEELTLYLHQTHRLGLVGEKTKVMKSQDFISEELTNQYQLEKLEILEGIEVINPYSFDEAHPSESEDEQIGEKLLDALVRIRKFDFLDLGVARAIVRRGRASKTPDLVEFLLDNCDHFKPIINDVVLYLDVVMRNHPPPRMEAMLIELCQQRVVEDQSSREWFAWLISNHLPLLRSNELRALVSTPDRLIYAAKAAVLTRNSAWVRERKDQLLNHGPWNRRAIIYSAQVLSDDERKHWLGKIPARHFTQLEQWMIDWVLAGAPRVPPLPSPPSEGLDLFDDLSQGLEGDIPF